MAELFCFREWILNSMNICWACFSALKNVLVPSVSNWNGIKSGISLNEVLLLHQNLFWALAPHSALQINNLAAISSNDYVLDYTYIWRSQELWYKSRSFLKMTQGFSEVITESYLLRQLLLSWCPLLNPWKKSYDQPRQHIQKQRHYFANKGPSSQGYGFSCGHVWMWELDYKESWEQNNWCFWTMVLEKILESPLDCKEIQPVHPEGDQSWTFIGRTDVEAETPKLWPPDVNSWLIWKDPDAGKDWRQEEKEMTEDEMVGWHHRLNGEEFE